MKKIPTLFIRDPKNMSRVTRDVHPDCEWVIAGEGIATVKLDGTACWWHEGKLWKRYTVKHGRTAPADFIPTGPPSELGKQAGWTLVTGESIDKYHREAFAAHKEPLVEGHTYELVGPKVQSNPYSLSTHELSQHGMHLLPPGYTLERSFDGIRTYLEGDCIEGLVWWRHWPKPGCDMAKIKRKDFGLPWPVKEK